MPTVDELVTNSTKLFSLPDVYLRLKAVLDDPDSSINEIATIISQDPALVGRILRIVNSSFFCIGTPIETIPHAVNMLGMQQIHDLALVTSMSGTFSGMSNEVMNMNVFWRNSIHCGLAAHTLASECNVLDGERLFVAGVLHDIGHLVMYQHIPELAQQALSQWQEQDRPLSQIERELIGFDYAQVGGKLTNAWGLPDSLQNSTTYHVEPADAQEEYTMEASIVHIAVGIASSNETTDLTTLQIDPFAWERTSLSPEILGPIAQDTRLLLDETAPLLFQ